MFRDMTPLERADWNMSLLIKNYNEHLEELPNKFRLLRMIVEDLIRDAKAYSLESQKSPETPGSETDLRLARLEAHLSQGPSAHNSLYHIHETPEGTGKMILPRSETPSSEATVKLEDTSDSSTISYSWSSLANRAGHLPQSVRQAIAASYSLQPDHGNKPAEVTLSIRIPKAATPPSGSASSLPVEEPLSRNGLVGDCMCTDGWFIGCPVHGSAPASLPSSSPQEEETR